MINVSDEIKQAYNDSTTQLDKIILNNNEYRITNVEYYDDTYEDGNIFGTAIARCLDFEIENNINLEKQEIEYQTGIKINGTTQWISLGNFIIQDVEPNDTTNIAKVSAMDYMLKTNTPYQTNLKYENGTVRILDVLLEVCNNTGLELATIDFANKDFIVDSNQFSEGTLNRQVIQAVAQISGTFAKIKNDNKLYLITPIRKTLYVKEVDKMLVSELNSLPIEKLSECNNKYSLDSYKELILKRNTHPINLVCLGMSDIEGENIVLRDENSIKKDGENSLIINNNPFAYKQKKREQLITALFENVKGFSYTSFEIKGQAKPYLETGDEVAVIDKKGNVSSSFLFRFNYKSPNGLESEMSAPSIIKATVEYQNVPDALEIAKRTEYIVDKQNQKIESLVSQVGDRTEKETSVTQDIDSITSRVHKLEEFTTTTTGTNQIHLDETPKGEGYILELKVKGNTENFKYLTPSDTLVPSDDLVPNGGHFTLVCDKQSRTSKSNEAVEIDVILDNPLRNVGDVYDELNIIDSKTTVTRRVGVNNDGSLYVLDKETTETLQDVKLTTFEDNTYVYIKEFIGLEYTAKYIVKNEYSDKFITKVEADTKIEQKAESIEIGVNKKLESYSTTEEMNSAIIVKANEINSEVKDKVGKDEVASTISQTADKIYFKSNNFGWESNNSSMTTDGKIITKSANIAGFDINNTSFIKNINGIYNYDEYDLLIALIGLVYGLSSLDYLCDANGDGTFNQIDVTKIINIISGNTESSKNLSGAFEINSSNPKHCLAIKRNGEIIASMGLGGINSNVLTSKYIVCGTNLSNSFNGIFLDGENSAIRLAKYGQYSTTINTDGITTPTLTQTSLEESKKNFEKLQDNALDIIKNIDIYKYNLKNEKDTDKKHIGFVIGDNYNYSKEVTSIDNKGVDNYSFTSLCCKAIQEQQEQIEQLQEKDKQKDEIITNLIKRIETLEKEVNNGKDNI